ncbi:unnamed protein product [Coregonus sp. 'balchen']|nr:unnamed protein product [Coregonus sp. 'balchen']
MGGLTQTLVLLCLSGTQTLSEDAGEVNLNDIMAQIQPEQAQGIETAIGGDGHIPPSVRETNLDFSNVFTNVGDAYNPASVSTTSATVCLRTIGACCLRVIIKQRMIDPTARVMEGLYI